MPPFSLLFFLFVITRASCILSTRVGKLNQAVEWSSIKNPRDQLETDTCRTGNPIDDCWRCDPDWVTNRKILADCPIGFGRNAIGGRDGEFYIVTESGDDDPVSPKPGTLRYGVIQEEPLWIIFDNDMVINLKEELIMNSYKTIDGRGADIHIAYGPCITIQNVTNIIIHGIHVHDCVPGGDAYVRDSMSHYGWRTISDGDGISIFGSTDVWVDHCTLYRCTDGLIDVIYGSKSITISNNYMDEHDEAMLMGHSDEFEKDKDMHVTIAFNYFGEGLVQRIPRCRHGYFHVVNNVYTGWEMYAIGGSANPTINSQGNIFIASNNSRTKEVTKREGESDDWESWNWRSDGDLMLNGAFFTASSEASTMTYTMATSMVARPASLVPALTGFAGAMNCQIGLIC
ncbi:putative pectate lyase 22 isoform X2 [Tasmannia lanceolata]|uniref:putative pectate lyase 22 isoform X2 n=1 Tax=Tasmannia lanceolata TaxID=3420 RepID=UPI004063538A